MEDRAAPHATHPAAVAVCVTRFLASMISASTDTAISAGVFAPMRKPTAQVEQLSHNDLRALQQLLARAGYDVGKIDGKLGAMTRAAVRQAQIKYGLPADSYPSLELMEKMRGTTLGSAR